jgi:4'-phosphopantetheinyl transferase
MKVEVIGSDINSAEMDCDPSKVHVFCIDINARYDPSESCYRSILSTDEMNKADRFFQIHDRTSFLVRRYYLRLLLSKLVSKSPRDLIFDSTGNKKPTLLGQEFNTSHSGQYAVIAIGTKPVGIDIEKIDHTFQFEDIVSRYFSSEEQMYLKARNTSHDFFHLWTRKEAMLKATGEGLVNNLHNLNCVPYQVLRNGLLYQLTTFGPEAGYVMSIASESAASKIQYRRI